MLILRRIKLDGLSRLRPLITILAPTFPAGFHSGAIQDSAHDGIAQTDVFDAAAAKEDHSVLLEVVTHAGHVSGHFHAIGQAHAGNLADGRVGLLRRFGRDLDADAALERRREETRAIGDRVESARQGDRFGLPLEALAMRFGELVYRWHENNTNLQMISECCEFRIYEYPLVRHLADSPFSARASLNDYSCGEVIGFYALLLTRGQWG